MKPQQTSISQPPVQTPPREFSVACLLLISILLSPPFTNANDLLDGGMGLPETNSGNNMIDSSAISNEPAPPTITPAQAADLVRRTTGGQVMSVNSQRTESGVVYGVKVLNSGRMRVIRVDGQTGRIINN
ncbi:MAG TPA: PepSY domain-containing protein [Cellvibrio sp.]|nr:PepSY domain-containing protein [Cellvibrio sp.]